MTRHYAISTVGAKEISPARKRWDSVIRNFRSTVGATLTRELFHFSIPTPRSLRLCVSVSLSSLNLSWRTN
jgi:hypothetical protein